MHRHQPWTIIPQLTHSYLSFFNFDQDSIEYMDQKCVLEKFGIQIKRVSKDIYYM